MGGCHRMRRGAKQGANVGSAEAVEISRGVAITNHKDKCRQNLSEYHLVCKLNKREDQTDTLIVINQPHHAIAKHYSLDL